MRIKLSDEVHAELVRQKYLLEADLTDEEFIAYILEARRQVLNAMAVRNIKHYTEDEE